ncbi:MAG: histidine kinase [Bacteroidales bacterium]|nr:histidine kinase [Bacteroidales bacterium]
MKKQKLSRTTIQFSNVRKTFRAINAFWIAIVGGLMLTAISLLAHVQSGWRLDSNFHFVYSLAVNFLLMFIILVSNFNVIKSNRLTLRWKYVVGIGSSIIVAVLFSAIAGWIHRILYDNIRLSDPDSINLTRDIIVAAFALLISIVLYSITRRQQVTLEKEKLQTENLMVRYEALEKQIDPHFLFNSLNTLSGLIGNDDNKAQQYLHQLASSYRYIMQAKRLVTLEDELNFVDSYSQMMQIRYGDNLKIERKVDSRYLHYQLIPISLQHLMENALKHNTISGRYPLTITLETTKNGNFRVSNPIRPKQEDVGNSGLGLANLRKRYQMLGQKDIIISNTDSTFSVEIPLIEPLQAAKIIATMKLDTNR